MKIYDLMFVETAAGKEKPNYNKCGILIVKDDGRVSVKINTLPVSKDWDGWLSAFENKPKIEPF